MSSLLGSMGFLTWEVAVEERVRLRGQAEPLAGELHAPPGKSLRGTDRGGVLVDAEILRGRRVRRLRGAGRGHDQVDDTADDAGNARDPEPNRQRLADAGDERDTNLERAHD